MKHNNISNFYKNKNGNLAWLAEAGIPVDESLIIRVPTSEMGGFSLGKQVAGMADQPTALLLCSEVTAAGVYAAFGEMGLEAGRDISVVAFRENPLMRFLNPAPACFRLDLDALGTRLGETVLDLLSPDEEINRRRGEIVPLAFMPGKSLQPPRNRGA
jgi:DNA-binding LacI/PurR family transcriptional regulator